jgi:hypothetical protein
VVVPEESELMICNVTPHAGAWIENTHRHALFCPSLFPSFFLYLYKKRCKSPEYKPDWHPSNVVRVGLNQGFLLYPTFKEEGYKMKGNGGTYPSLQAYSGTGPELTLTGTCLDKSVVSTGGDIWGYADVFDNGRVSLSNAIQADGTSVDLPFIDFLKIVTAVHYADPILGERSTEAGTPTDRLMPNPEMLISGSGPSGGLYSYTFTNNSGYVLTVSFDGDEFTVAVGGTVIKTSTKSSVYIDFYGGNAKMESIVGAVTFTNMPAS